MLLEAETNKYCPGGYDFGAISNLITWVLNFFLSEHRIDSSPLGPTCMDKQFQAKALILHSIIIHKQVQSRNTLDMSAAG
jgi:hypothetical protein